ncbi:unnamed protein product [Amoebophrya sp. A25]|nr:unnamed protein product [Amoebophrya sp. A25]|eukprot:GSA25T00008001001.1
MSSAKTEDISSHDILILEKKNSTTKHEEEMSSVDTTHSEPESSAPESTEQGFVAHTGGGESDDTPPPPPPDDSPEDDSPEDDSPVVVTAQPRLDQQQDGTNNAAGPGLQTSTGGAAVVAPPGASQLAGQLTVTGAGASTEQFSAQAGLGTIFCIDGQFYMQQQPMQLAPTTSTSGIMQLGSQLQMSSTVIGASGTPPVAPGGAVGQNNLIATTASSPTAGGARRAQWTSDPNEPPGTYVNGMVVYSGEAPVFDRPDPSLLKNKVGDAEKYGERGGLQSCPELQEQISAAQALAKLKAELESSDVLEHGLTLDMATYSRLFGDGSAKIQSSSSQQANGGSSSCPIISGGAGVQVQNQGPVLEDDKPNANEDTTYPPGTTSTKDTTATSSKTTVGGASGDTSSKTTITIDENEMRTLAAASPTAFFISTTGADGDDIKRELEDAPPGKPADAGSIPPAPITPAKSSPKTTLDPNAAVFVPKSDIGLHETSLSLGTVSDQQLLASEPLQQSQQVPSDYVLLDGEQPQAQGFAAGDPVQLVQANWQLPRQQVYAVINGNFYLAEPVPGTGAPPSAPTEVAGGAGGAAPSRGGPLSTGGRGKGQQPVMYSNLNRPPPPAARSKNFYSHINPPAPPNNYNGYGRSNNFNASSYNSSSIGAGGVGGTRGLFLASGGGKKGGHQIKGAGGGAHLFQHQMSTSSGGASYNTTQVVKKTSSVGSGNTPPGPPVGTNKKPKSSIYQQLVAPPRSTTHPAPQLVPHRSTTSSSSSTSLKAAGASANKMSSGPGTGTAGAAVPSSTTSPSIAPVKNFYSYMNKNHGRGTPPSVTKQQRTPPPPPKDRPVKRRGGNKWTVTGANPNTVTAAMPGASATPPSNSGPLQVQRPGASATPPSNSGPLQQPGPGVKNNTGSRPEDEARRSVEDKPPASERNNDKAKQAKVGARSSATELEAPTSSSTTNGVPSASAGENRGRTTSSGSKKKDKATSTKQPSAEPTSTTTSTVAESSETPKFTSETPKFTPEAGPSCDLSETERHEMKDVLNSEDCAVLKEIWEKYRDDLEAPKLEKKPELTSEERDEFFRLSNKVVQRMAGLYQAPLSLDQAQLSATNASGHKRHADNFVFKTRRKRSRTKSGSSLHEMSLQDMLRPSRTSSIGSESDLVLAEQDSSAAATKNKEESRTPTTPCVPVDVRSVDLCKTGPAGEASSTAAADEESISNLVVFWKTNSTAHRNYAASVNLVAPSDYEGGEVRFFVHLYDAEPCSVYKSEKGCGVCFTGCPKNVHDVTGVTSGFRLCLLVWTRPGGTSCPKEAQNAHYHRPGTGEAVWLNYGDMTKGQQESQCMPQTEGPK